MLRAALLALLACAAFAPPAHADVRWLCSPALAGDPCRGDQTTRVFEPDGSSRVEQVTVPATPAVDCFYVYPTVSNQITPNATQTAEPEVRSIATLQARPFSSRCRVFAPLYRQVTPLGVSLASQARDTAPYETALADVREAFQRYCARTTTGADSCSSVTRRAAGCCARSSAATSTATPRCAPGWSPR